MTFPKFIIEGENLIIGKCKYHKQLALNVNNVKGGGWFRYDSDSDTFILSGESHDFGPAKMEDIKTCVESGKVYGNTRLTRNMSKHNFSYDIGSEIIPLKVNKDD